MENKIIINAGASDTILVEQAWQVLGIVPKFYKPLKENYKCMCRWSKLYRKALGIIEAKENSIGFQKV